MGEIGKVLQGQLARGLVGRAGWPMTQGEASASGSGSARGGVPPIRPSGNGEGGVLARGGGGGAEQAATL